MNIKPDLLEALGCREQLLQTTSNSELITPDEMDECSAQNAILFEALANRFLAVEVVVNELRDKRLALKAADETWSLAMRARDRAVFANQAGEVAIVPAALMDLLASGRAADVRVSKVDGGVLLDDEREEQTVVPLSFFINLARIARQWESGRISVPVPSVPPQADRRESGEEESHV